MSKRVSGIGGIFFRSKDPKASRAWYNKHLGLNTHDYGATFEWRKSDNKESKGYTAWSPFPQDTEYMNPSGRDFMINFRVENLEELLSQLKAEGVEVVGEIETFEYGKFAHIMDPDGVKIELWEPNDEVFGKMSDGGTTC